MLPLEQSQDVPPSEQHQESESGSLQSVITPAPSFGSGIGQHQILLKLDGC